MRITVPITKVNERREFGGWAYVSKSVDGAQVVDHSGDVVDDVAWESMRDAFVDYALESRAGDDMHATFGVAKLAELFVSDEERWAQLGIPEGTLPRGVFATFRAESSPEGDALWDAVKSGKRLALSIVGSGRREE